MTRRTIATVSVVLVMAGGLLAGCAADQQADTAGGGGARAKRSGSAASPLNSNTDPCAMRLHDVSGPLLLYYGRYQRLPPKIDELGQVPGVSVPELTCPVSGQKYIYDPHGPPGPDAGTRIILYDATPAHAGRRWGVAVREPSREQALVAKVVIVPEAAKR